jgi:hypothetical protein
MKPIRETVLIGRLFSTAWPARRRASPVRFKPGLMVSIAVCAAILPRGPSLGAAKDQSKTESYDDGKPHFVYSVDSEGRKTGEFRELAPDGHPLISATYAKDDLNGAYRSFFPGGKPKVVANYANGKLSGKYREFAESGEAAVVANYKAGELNGPRQEILPGKVVRSETWRTGKLHGWRREAVKERVVTNQFWYDGQLVIPKSSLIIAQGLAAIEKTPISFAGEFPKVTAKLEKTLNSPELTTQNEAGLRALMAYRFLCDVPYKDLQIDREYMAHAQAGAEIMDRIGKLTHTPENPGMPEDEYQFAYKGTSSSNIYFDSKGATTRHSIDSYMDDSDERNIEVVGHRRWCLNPAMLKTGFGVAGIYSAMWAMDASRKDVPDYDAVLFPPRGLTPTSHFKSSYAWSISLNPRRYSDPDSTIKISVTPMRFDPKKLILEPGSEPLEIEHLKIAEPIDGRSKMTCIIFRPKNVNVSAGSVYKVGVSGLKATKSQDASLEYFVGFFDPVK